LFFTEVGNASLRPRDGLERVMDIRRLRESDATVPEDIDAVRNYILVEKLHGRAPPSMRARRRSVRLGTEQFRMTPPQ
jgi:hypothetical protein